ncbi:LPS export ABC transporter permease LptG [Croceicoccus naphthovorans]|uniref:Permease n=1 Tax=Croceicoccus naphthovorans TaxID=1348774 RepID=A0A0G3XEU8_9SPHN|nr:LPS export ABC transporter permease LptG [Croceicoccus naphthovorans]AKM08918.1 permease [Croceicoccus naphthovorans]MBB3989301.1 lipopolysaccharide export system permease protein [Croceicoccus naphthovorans]
MRLDFLPSWRLTVYLAKTFVVRIFAVLAMLVLVLQILDLLGTSGEILAVDGNSEAQLWTYVSLRAPQLVARFLPYSVLLATILTLATLNQNSEVIAMKAAGLSAHQILAPLVLTAALVSLLSFGFNERIVTRATATLSAWEKADWGPVPVGSSIKSNIYMADGDAILVARTAVGSGDAMRLGGVTWYRRDPNLMLTEQWRATDARWTGDGWELSAPRRFTVSTAKLDTMPDTVVGAGITPREIAISSVNADAQDIVTLRKSIDALKDAGRRTEELEGRWWHKISGPLSAALMPLLGAVAAFGLARSGQLFVRAVIGMALGFAYFVVDNAALAIGNFGGYPPFLAAWSPFLLFALIGELVLLKTEE